MSEKKSFVTVPQIAIWHLIALAIVAAANPGTWYGVKGPVGWLSTFIASLVFGAVIFAIWVLFRRTTSGVEKARSFFVSSWCCLALGLIGTWRDVPGTGNGTTFLILVAIVIIEKVVDILIESVHGAAPQSEPAPLPAAPAQTPQRLTDVVAAPLQSEEESPVVPFAPEPPPRPTAKEPDTIQARQMEEAFYEQVATEMAARQVKKGL